MRQISYLHIHFFSIKESTTRWTSTCSGLRNDVCSFFGYTVKQDQILGQFSQSSLLNMPRNIILKIIEINYLEKFKSPKMAEMAENGRFVGPRGPNYNPFLTILC